jgi:spermidine synthase
MSDFLRYVSQERPFVHADSESVALHFKIGELQSLMSLQKPNRLQVPYTKTMMGFVLAIPNPDHILMIGLGGGSLAKFCYHHLPQARITVVEINPHVIALRRRFQIPEDDARFAIICADGADFVRDAKQGFDVILVDGFDAQGQSTQLTSRTFYEDCCRVLMPNGIMVVNLDSDHPAHGVYLARIDRAYQGRSMEVAVEDRGNRVVFAAKGVAKSLGFGCLKEFSAHLTVEVQLELQFEFQHILRTLNRPKLLAPEDAAA